MLVKRLELSALQNRGLQRSGQPVRNNNGFNLPKDQGVGRRELGRHDHRLYQAGLCHHHITQRKGRGRGWRRGRKGAIWGRPPPFPHSPLPPSQKSKPSPWDLPVLVSFSLGGVTCFKPCCCDFSGFFSTRDLPKSLSATFECHVTENQGWV